MSDRELLELAAKAAGMANNGFTSGRGLHVSGEPEYDGGWWNPLADDGDALRLAVKLRLEVEWRNDGRVSAFKAAHCNEEALRPIFESSRENVEANLRRAIVRAAAELGRSMP